jgi:hypothetical protein
MTHQPCPITVTTFHIDDPDTAETTHDIDHNDVIHRNWLTRHMFWALRNNRGVEISPRVSA